VVDGTGTARAEAVYAQKVRTGVIVECAEGTAEYAKAAECAEGTANCLFVGRIKLLLDDFFLPLCLSSFLVHKRGS